MQVCAFQKAIANLFLTIKFDWFSDYGFAKPSHSPEVEKIDSKELQIRLLQFPYKNIKADAFSQLWLLLYNQYRGIDNPQNRFFFL